MQMYTYAMQIFSQYEFHEKELKRMASMYKCEKDTLGVCPLRKIDNN